MKFNPLGTLLNG